MELLVPHAATHITLLQGAGQPLEGTDSERPLPSPRVCCDSTRDAVPLLAIRRTLLMKELSCFYLSRCKIKFLSNCCKFTEVAT